MFTFCLVAGLRNFIMAIYKLLLASTDGSNIRFLGPGTVYFIVHIVVKPNALVSAQWGRGPHNKGREMNERWKDC